MCLWLIHVDGWQKPTQLCKAIILQLKNKFKIKKKIKLKGSHLRCLELASTTLTWLL